MTDEHSHSSLGPGRQPQPRGPLGARPRNSELAKQVAGDAQRVVAGDLSEEEFYDKYHEAYLKEFGFDNRPRGLGDTARDVGGEGGALASSGGLAQAGGQQPAGSVGNGPISRRAFLMLAGGGAAALALATSLGNMVPRVAFGSSPEATGPGGPSQQGKRRVQMGMVIDLERCTGCLACVDGCHRENNLEPGVHWMYVISYDDPQHEGEHHLVRPCQHCTNPPCVRVCPTMARHKRELDGLVLTDYDVCAGTRYCEVACPYGVNYFQWGEPNPDTEEIRRQGRKDYRGETVAFNPPRGVMGKCNFCPQRMPPDGKRKAMSCQQACPHDAIFFGDMNDPESLPNRYLEEKRREKGMALSTFRLLEEMGTGPNILYIGHQPHRKAKQVDGAVTMEDWGWIDERGPALGGPRPWFMRVFGG